jgi:hypothetical protein
MRLAIAALSLLTVGACSRPAGEPAAGSPTPSSTATLDPARPLPSPMPEVVARVNGQPVGLSRILALAQARLLEMPESEREARTPEALRQALDLYIERELLLQEALARGVEADTRVVQWAYDQARREHTGETSWTEFLATLGLDEPSFKSELRTQHTVAALLAQEMKAVTVSDDEARAAFEADPTAFGPPGETPASFEGVRDAVRESLLRQKRGQVSGALQARLRARARIEILI